MKDFIFISGAPGSGKTTVSKLLQKELSSPLIDFGDIRQFHLDKEWSNTSVKEEEMSFENLLFILKNYKKYGYDNVIVNDLKDDKIQTLQDYFSDCDYVIFTLIIKNNDELKERVSKERDSGWKNVSGSIDWNKNIQQRSLLPNEIRIDNTHNNPNKTAEEILELLRK